MTGVYIATTLVLPGADSRTVVSADGVRLAVYEAGVRGAPTLVFVHGYPDTHAVWTPVLERLADRFHVVAYDVRGAGASDRPRGPRAYVIARLIDDFAAVADAVAPDRGVHLIGHDWGAIAGWEFAASERLTGRLSSFTAIAGPALDHALLALQTSLRRGRIGEWLDRVRRSWYIAVLCAPGGPTLAWRLIMGGGRWRRALRRLDRVPTDADYPAATVVADGLAGANLYRANIPHRLVRPARAPAPIAVPVQVILPADDRFISRHYYAAAERAAPRLHRVTVPGSHWLPRVDPERVAELVAGHLPPADG